MTLRLAFMGSPEFAIPTLKAVKLAGHTLACVYSQPPRPAGRGQTERRTAIHRIAEAAGLTVRTPVNFKSAEDREAFAALNLDAAVVVAYGLLLPRAILEAPRLGCLNLHGSLLPRWRGAAPIQRAVMAQDAETGVEVMQMDVGLDTGPVLMSSRTPISASDTAGDVHDRLAHLGAQLMVAALAAIETGTANPRVQPEAGVTYAAKIAGEETRIDWSRPADSVSAQIRGLSPHPGAWFEMPGEKGPVRIKALNALVEGGSGAPGEILDDRLLIACGAKAVRVTRLQRAGKGPMTAVEFLRGARAQPGRRLE